MSNGNIGSSSPKSRRGSVPPTRDDILGHSLDSHRLKTLSAESTGRWALRRFSHDSALTPSSTPSSLDTFTSTDWPKSSLHPISTNASKISPKVVRTPAPKTSQDPINIITDYGVIPAPLTPSPSVKSPKGSPRGSNAKHNEANCSGKFLSPKGSPRAKQTGSVSPKSVLKSRKEGNRSPIERVKKVLSLEVTNDPQSSPGNKLHIVETEHTLVRGKDTSGTRRRVSAQLGRKISDSRGRGRAGSVRSRNLSVSGHGQRSVSVLIPKLDQSFNKNATHSLSCTPSKSPQGPRKRKPSTEGSSPKKTRSPSSKTFGSLGPAGSKGSSPRASPKADPSRPRKQASSAILGKKTIHDILKTYPSRIRQQRVSISSNTSVSKSPTASGIDSRTEDAMNIKNKPQNPVTENVPVVQKEPMKSKKIDLKSKVTNTQPTQCKRIGGSQMKQNIGTDKKPRVKARLGVIVKPKGKTKTLNADKASKAQKKSTIKSKMNVKIVKRSQKMIKAKLKTKSVLNLKKTLEGFTDLREILDKRRKERDQVVQDESDHFQVVLIGTSPIDDVSVKRLSKGKTNFSHKRKKANLTLQLAKKLKTAAKRRVNIQGPVEKSKIRLAKLSPRSPRKSPRIILKDVIRLSKIEYDMSVAVAEDSGQQRSPARNLHLDNELHIDNIPAPNIDRNISAAAVHQHSVPDQGNKRDTEKKEKPVLSKSIILKVKEKTLTTRDTKKKASPPKTKDAPKRAQKLKEVTKGKGRGKRPLTPDTSDDDVLYSINPDYDGDDSDSDLSLSPRSKKKGDVSKSPAKKPHLVSPRKMLLKDSIKPKSPPYQKEPHKSSPTKPAGLPPVVDSTFKTPTKPDFKQPASHINPIVLNSPSNDTYTNLLKNLPQSLQPSKVSKKTSSKTSESGEEEDKGERRVSVRNSESAFRYKEIIVKKCPGYTQMWLFTTTKSKNSLNPKVMQELSQALHNAKFDDSRLVLLSGSGSVFCSGLDLNFLLSGDRRQSAQTMADALKDFVNVLISFPKPIVAAVNGPAIGLGAAILPLCDIIYASDKASFYSPYARLSQTPEGCSSFTFPQVMGMAMANELLLGGRKVTAIEACQIGLVSQVFWPTSMMQEVIPRVRNMALQSIRSLEASKLLIRSHQRAKLEITNESECRMLVERWSSLECQKAMRTYLDDELDFLM